MNLESVNKVYIHQSQTNNTTQTNNRQLQTNNNPEPNQVLTQNGTKSSGYSKYQ